MSTQVSFLIDNLEVNQLENFMNSRLKYFDIDFSISKYDYFDINEYKAFISCLSFPINENSSLFETLDNVDFAYEIELGASFFSLENNYLPCLNDYFAQSLSLERQCHTLTFINKSINGDDSYPITHFFCGKEIMDFSSFNNIEVWGKDRWIKNI
ncbi:hypothetical protein [Gilliamella sp. wkB112]|uniref:hypothetical protein n=1 Tax=Gilliamella sp. wkB112 TaxID=3120257 RepID=UPI00080DD5D6|nr:hypothetical protein [Gilliamella apicola]OCG05716.1 hypothetical protein A9G12_00065 [Gilliamella apicola]